jgi:hypothetical protein
MQENSAWSVTLNLFADVYGIQRVVSNVAKPEDRGSLLALICCELD